jgi:hypothetical protein
MEPTDDGERTEAADDSTMEADNNKNNNDEQSREDDDDADDGDMPSATGTLDRKTSQASPTACLYNNQHKTREA